MPEKSEMPAVLTDDLRRTEMQAYHSRHTASLSLNMPVTQPDASHRGFLDLPGELRNKIYTYLFQSTTFKITAASSQRAPACIAQSANNLSLLRTCRKIHTEARDFPYALGTFSISYIDDLDLLLSRFTKEQQKAITSLQVVPGTLPCAWYWGAWHGHVLIMRCPRWWDPWLVRLPELPSLKQIHVQVAFDPAQRSNTVPRPVHRRSPHSTQSDLQFTHVEAAMEEVKRVFRQLHHGANVTCVEVLIAGV
ncbi:hypothetical protein BDU57DRAFT_542456 [Ampelomyces quisqualis]|uniref:DUF7730 domain-containing protein n=1 Tax=Ampelomyces quisqualis TaxID=50730 RepID=A0A6A5QCR2_AMPQU|nr:hypothetical protein BDU57DRAFT_542456 [Ampelomyces quisqualis]